MNPNLSGHQFTAYRGLLVDTGRAPASDDEVLEHLRAKGPDGTAYGQHWTLDHETARRFVSNLNAGGYETIPARMRRFNGGGDKWGVVLEAQAHGPAYEKHIPYSEHEREVSIHRDSDHPAANNLTSVRAHVYDLLSRETVAKMHPLGQPGTGRLRSETWRAGYTTPARSFDVPDEHWRNA